jgi:hypothetical protein
MIPPLEFPMTNIYIFAATIFAFGLSATLTPKALGTTHKKLQKIPKN